MKEKLIVKKPKWIIKAVPWSESETGLMLKMAGDPKLNHDKVKVTPLTKEEILEFIGDSVAAFMSRYDIEFPNDSKPKISRLELSNKFMVRLDHILQAHKLSYIV